jgi:two-component system cell cycle sensor histidine kinase PleC
MRSSAPTDAGAGRFGAGSGMDQPAGPLARAAKHIRDAFSQISPTSWAVAATSFACAATFTVFDVARSLDEARADLILMGQVIAERAPAAPETIVPAFISATYGGRPDGVVSIQHHVPLDDGQVITLSTPPDHALAGVPMRAGGAFALALLVTGVSLRRRRAEMPEDSIDTDLSQLVCAIPQGVACWSADGRLISANALYWLAIDSKPDAGLHYGDAVKRLIRGGYMKLVTSGDSSRLLELHREDGSCLHIEERPFGDAGFVTLVLDVTDRKRAEAQLEEIRKEQRQLARRYHEEKLKAEAASRSKTNFLAHLSHDIRTPLNHIIGFAELIGHQAFGPVGDARYLDYIDSIRQSGKHLLDSFATILDLAEMEGGQKALRSDAIAIDDIVASAARRFGAQAQRAGVRLVITQRSGAILAGDALCLERMVSNIVENALRFTPSGGRVTLATFAAEDGIVIEITDTGIGMSEERLASLSQPFALGDATFTREGVGPGLGIPIARAIAELSGGHMAVDSSPAIGTTVAFMLPIRPAETPSQRAA